MQYWGREVISVDLTASDVTDAGFSVAKVFVPGLQPLVFGPVIPADTRRLESFAQNVLRKPAVIHRMVHPFA